MNDLDAYKGIEFYKIQNRMLKDSLKGERFKAKLFFWLWMITMALNLAGQILKFYMEAK